MIWRREALSIAFAWAKVLIRSRCLLRLLKSSKQQILQRVNYPTDCLWLSTVLSSLTSKQTRIKNEHINRGWGRPIEIPLKKEAFAVCKALWELSFESLAWSANDASNWLTVSVFLNIILPSLPLIIFIYKSFLISSSEIYCKLLYL